MLIAQINIVSFRLFLIRSGFNELEGLHGAGFHTCLFAIYTALFVPVRGVDAKVALSGFAYLMVPDRSVGLLWTHFETGLASDAFSLVNPSDVAVLSVHVGGPYRTINNTGGRDTLPAWSYLYVIRKLAKGILYYLYTGE
jgi:hypothetical protein